MLKVLFAASEALPYASTGGLADVIGSLPKAIKKELGDECDIRVVIPFILAQLSYKSNSFVQII